MNDLYSELNFTGEIIFMLFVKAPSAHALGSEIP